MWVGGQHHAPAALPPGKIRCPLYRRLGGPQGRSGRVRKISPLTGIWSPHSPARSESLYRLRYSGSLLFYIYTSLRHIVKVRVIVTILFSGPKCFLMPSKSHSETALPVVQPVPTQPKNSYRTHWRSIRQFFFLRRIINLNSYLYPKILKIIQEVLQAHLMCVLRTKKSLNYWRKLKIFEGVCAQKPEVEVTLGATYIFGSPRK